MIEVVIPAYNAARFLRETLHCVAAQTVRPGQVTVVDDASTDDTIAVAQACAAELRDRIAIQVLRNAGPRGPSAARNTAIRQSSAACIALLDADDILAPGHHATLLRALDAAKDAVLGFGDSTVFKGQSAFDDAAMLVESFFAVSGVAALPATAIAPGCFTLGEGMFTALLRNGVFGTSACLFRREAALAAGLFDETMMQCEDTDFFLRLALTGRFVFSRDVVTHKRVHDDNLSHERHKLAFCRGTALSLAKMTEWPGLSAAQSAALREAFSTALDGYLYNASRTSLPAYWRAASLALRAGHGARAASPRHLARLALHGFL
ncbi:glycosyltransferase family 2 protein [Limobrevibacterium gyesilva]|uniref:Glycosyltransferase family 2 protein n=1 Tax=Limobrevibacterium gyesilva TaxID=2991712 RepID=A0AA42CFR0_9PROT|nr:glycosyltransferase family A protein [Limobrevibacterium gyesilva]MCW3476929.1 glycosyltransferase family 2 protein [Limobrevibacterium gyesilva]